MWLLELLFFAVTLTIGWTLFGYFIFMWVVGRTRPSKPVELPQTWPALSIVVPCYNEEDQILEKLADLRALDYPADSLEIIFAEGGSTDRTAELLASALPLDGRIRVVRCPRKGKINQLNHVLPQLSTDIAIVTDTDARLNADAIKWMVAEFEADPQVAVVGAYSRPGDALGIEDYWWAGQNRGRFIESDAHTSFIVIAQCYAFRTALLRTFPEDVVADDIYVAFLANTLGQRTVYSRKAWALETRTPQTYADFIPHKLRKSNAFLRECLRIIYRLPEMDGFWRTMVLTRTAQQLLVPWGAVWWMFLGAVLITLGRVDLVIFTAAFLLVVLLCASQVFAWTALPDGDHRFSFMMMVRGYTLSLAILLVTGVTYPFYRQDSSYSRLTVVPRREPAVTPFQAGRSPPPVA